MRILLALVAAAFALAACDGGGSPEDVQGVVDALEEEGIACEDLETTSEFGSEGDAEVKERGLCAVEGESVVVSIFDDPGARRRWVAAAAEFSPVVSADKWAIGSDSPDLLSEIADALDGTISAPEDNEEE